MYNKNQNFIMDETIRNKLLEEVKIFIVSHNHTPGCDCERYDDSPKKI